MTLNETQQKTSQILDAERVNPTLQYLSTVPFVNQTAALLSPLGQRGQHPRPVAETPGRYPLQSRNYDLLKTYAINLDADDRNGLYAMIARRIAEQNPFRTVGENLLGFGQTGRTNSELPLVAELLVRHGQAKRLLVALLDAPLRPGLTRLLLQLEEMIALDYRLFSDSEYDQLRRLVIDLAAKMVVLWKLPKLGDTKESNYRFNVGKEGPVICESIAEQCEKAKYLRLVAGADLEASGRLEGIDALEPNSDDENFEVLAGQVRSAIEGGRPELGLDRLHTFALKFIRTAYERHFDRSAFRTATANSLLGELANDLRDKGIIQSKMASEILKSSARVLDEFNHVRNNQTFAHDNPTMITKAEAQFLYQSVAASIRFLRQIETGSEFHEGA